jgi:hypothetical protein
MQHCMKAFSRGLKVNTAIEELVWAHSEGPAEARKVATEYFARNYRRIQVGTIYNCVSMFPGLGMRARVFSFLTLAFYHFNRSLFCLCCAMWAARGTRDVAAAEAAGCRRGG